MNQPPTQVGPYSIVREVGRGGMGVVYLAHDARLERDVAIKSLPAEFAVDPARLERFEREARTLAGLSHPNVAGILGVEDGTGEQEGTRFLVLEYVAGETIADRLDGGPIPVLEALEIAIGVASGIEAAHEAGVIHRDLKPANVKLTEGGVPKVLDFGLARVDDSQTGSSIGGLDSPTMTAPLPQHSPTIEGAILGTAAYMSPEQARGRRVDKRTDVWSFGVLLFEMLAGAGPFQGETATDSIGAVLHKDPDLGLLPEDVPVGVATMIRRCLVRDRTQRLQAIGDARVELQEAVRRIEAGEPEFPDREPATAPPPRGIARFAWPLLAAVLAIALVTLAVLRPSVRNGATDGAAPDAGEGALPRVVEVRQVTDVDGSEWDPALSPDGRTLAFSLRRDGHEDVYVQRIGGGNPINLTEDSPFDEFDPAFSPDGERIAYASSRDGGGIFVMGATGENPRRVADAGFDPAWSPDGARLAFTSERVDVAFSRQASATLSIVDLESGEVTVLDTRRDDEDSVWSGDAVGPAWSPDGRLIAFWAVDGGQRDLFVVPVDGGTPVTVTSDPHTDWNPAWSPSGDRLLFLSDRGGANGAWSVRVDPATGAPIDEPEPLAIGPASFGEAAFAADGSTALAMVPRAQYVVERMRVDLAERRVVAPPERLRATRRAMSNADVSADGRTLVYMSDDPNEDLHVLDVESGRARNLTSDVDRDRGPVLTTDEERVVFFSSRGGGYRIWEIRLDGSGLRPLSPEQGPRGLTTPMPSPDGRLMAVLGAGGGGFELLLFDVGEDGLLEQRAVAHAGVGPLAWSPDSSRLACFRMRADGPSLELYDPVADAFEVVRGSTGDATSLVAVTSGDWIDDRRFVTTDRENQRIVVHDVDSGETFSIGAEVSGPASVLVVREDGDDDPDLVTLLVVRGEGETDAWLLGIDGFAD